MNKIKLWLSTGRIPIIIFIFLCLFIVIGLLLIWYTLWGKRIKEGLYVNIADNTVSNLDTVVDSGGLTKLNDIPNTGAPIIFSTTPPVAQYEGPDPEFPLEGSIMKCSVDDINGNGSYYMVTNTDPKVINLFPNDDRSVINSWSDTWASAPSFKNCTSFTRGSTMERRTPLPDVGTDIHCKNEDSQADRHTYRVMSRVKIQPFPGRQEDPDQIVAKSWNVDLNNLTPIDDCSNIPKVHDNLGNVKKFKYKVKINDLDRKLVRCRQSTPGSSQTTPGDHGTSAVYKVENRKLRWFQNVNGAYTSSDNISSWNLAGNPVIDVPSCDEIELGENIKFNGKKLLKNSYTKCSIDVPNGAGIGQVYKVMGDDGKLNWVVSDEIASFFDPNYNVNYVSYYPDCSSFSRGPDITKFGTYYRDYTSPGNYAVTIPTGCIGLKAITIGGGGGGGGGCNGWYQRNRHDGGGGSGGGGGGGGVTVYNNSNGYKVSINDSNRDSSLRVVVGAGGAGGGRGVGIGDSDGAWGGPGCTAGGRGGDSYFYLSKNNNSTVYFRATGGGGGDRGEFARDYRGRNGSGGGGGYYYNPNNDHLGYNGTSGETTPQDWDPYHHVRGGYGGNPTNIPGEVPNWWIYGKGGQGGQGSIRGYDQSTNGIGGSNGFVRIIFIF